MSLPPRLVIPFFSLPSFIPSSLSFPSLSFHSLLQLHVTLPVRRPLALFSSFFSSPFLSSSLSFLNSSFHSFFNFFISTSFPSLPSWLVLSSIPLSRFFLHFPLSLPPPIHFIISFFLPFTHISSSLSPFSQLFPCPLLPPSLPSFLLFPLLSSLPKSSSPFSPSLTLSSPPSTCDLPCGMWSKIE